MTSEQRQPSLTYCCPRCAGELVLEQYYECDECGFVPSHGAD